MLWVEGQGLSGMQAVTAFPVGFILLGTFAEGFAILVLTAPLVQPILESPGAGPIRFGVLMEIVPKMALISPPVGINVFVAKGIAPNVTLNTIIRGVWPFRLAMLAAVIPVLLLPGIIALLLPNGMHGCAPATLCSPRRPVHVKRRRHDSVRRIFPARPQPASGGVAPSNAALVPRTADICAEHDFPTATPGEARTMPGLEAVRVRSNV